MKAPLLKELYLRFQKEQNAPLAQKMSQYMKGHFPFFGLPAPFRRKIQKELFQQFPLSNEEELLAIVQGLWNKPERECQYAALDLLTKYKKLWNKEFLSHFENLLQEKSWWDSVDTLAPLMGALLFQENSLKTQTEKWITHSNFWLRRSALIFQLRYREKTDWEKLFRYILLTCSEKEFFIRKAIGWALREYSKTAPQKVAVFLNTHRNQLSPLSVREASKYISKIKET